MKAREKVTRKDSRTHLEQFNLACEIVKVIRRFFPDLIAALKEVHDPRHQSYITYGSHVLLMTRILSAIFYISSMRKTSEEFNSEEIIENIGFVCGETELKELPYWETINDYLKRLDPDELQKVVCQIVGRLIRSRAFEDGRLRGKYWRIIIDGTQLKSSRKELDPKCLRRVHNKGKDDEYTEYYYYVMEAKLYLRENIQVSILTEFVENEETETGKQDCERNAAYRMMERLKKEFPMMPVCMMGDSLYACEPFFRGCEERKWKYLIRYKKGSIPGVYAEYEAIRRIENTCCREKTKKVRNGMIMHAG